jgi:hypothetical protein
MLPPFRRCELKNQTRLFTGDENSLAAWRFDETIKTGHFMILLSWEKATPATVVLYGDTALSVLPAFLPPTNLR